MDGDLFDKAAALIKSSRNCVALTGAGVSTESGIPDFRGRDGLWSRYDPVEYGTLGAFRINPQKVWRMLAELLDVVDARIYRVVDNGFEIIPPAGNQGALGTHIQKGQRFLCGGADQAHRFPDVTFHRNHIFLKALFLDFKC